MNIKFDLEKCHGIKTMNADLKFGEHNLIVIHSPNGLMKTSLTKTIKEISERKDTIDAIDGMPCIKRDVLIDGKKAKAEDFKVFENSEEPDFATTISRSLLNNALKEKLITSSKDLEQSKMSLLNLVKAITGLQPKNIIDELRKYYKIEIDNQLLNYVYVQMNRTKNFVDVDFPYKDIFSDTVQKFLMKDETKQALKDYEKFYTKMMTKSSILTSGVFDYSNLTNVRDCLYDNRFFEGGNSIKFKNSTNEVKSIDELKRIVQIELDNISNSPEVKDKFDKFIESSKKAKAYSKALEIFRNKPSMLKEIRNIENYKKKYLLSAFKEHKNEFDDFKTKYDKFKMDIKTILKEARKESKTWQHVVSKFNNMFSMPFKLEINHARDAVLGQAGFNIKFIYDNIVVDETNLVNNVLSGGEKRAFCLLNHMFEIETLAKENKRKILVFDDIADSFDYTNKHAITEFIYDTLESNKKFYGIVLTHNFDFYRTLSSKISSYKGSYFATGDKGNIVIEQGEYFKNIYISILRKDEQENRATIRTDLGIIPFARSITELNDDDYFNNPNYKFYCKLLHYRPNGAKNILISTLYKRFKSDLNLKMRLPVDGHKQVYKAIAEEAEKISNETSIKQSIVDKLILVIALRIRAEKYMYVRLLGKKKIAKSEIECLEYGKLLGKFKKSFPKNKYLNYLEKIRIFAPESIHLNAFNYESIIDYSITRLRTLYKSFSAVSGKF